MSEFIILLIFTLINAFFALSEIALVQSSKPLLRQMSKQGSKRAALALSLAEDTGRTLSTIQVGITLVGILAGAYGGANIAEKFAAVLENIPVINVFAEEIALGTVVLLITYLSVVIGEIVPKQYALAHPEKLAIFAAYPLKLVAQIGAPVVYVLNKSAEICLTVMGIKAGDSGNVTEAEVHAVLHEGAESGAIEPGEYEMLRRIIALGDREVKTIMTPRVDVVSLDVSDDLTTVRQVIIESGHSRFPVIDGTLDNLKGVVAARDVLEIGLLNEPFDIMKAVREPPILSDNIPCHKVLELFKNYPVNLAMVIDEYGNIEGIVTTADILEAIVGSVASNYEDNEHNIVQREDGSWLVNGLTAVDDLVLTVGIEGLDRNDHFTTLAGYILHHFGYTPKVGESFVDLDHRFEVVDLDGRRIDKVLITKDFSESEDSKAMSEEE